MAQLQGEHLRPHAPAVRVSDGHRHLKVRPKMFPHRLVLAPLEEARTGRRLPELSDQGNRRSFPFSYASRSILLRIARSRFTVPFEASSDWRLAT
jgi:hypothetical protein